MVEPLSTAIVATGAAAILKEPVQRLLGPTADFFGKEMAAFVEKRAETWKRVSDNAVEKLGERLDVPGSVSPRLLKAILDEGTLSEDTVVVDYYGGVLASSRSADGANDMAICATAQIARMSSHQLRAHYLIYSTLRALYRHVRPSLNFDDDRNKLRFAFPLDRFCQAMGWIVERDSERVMELVEHVLYGLHREGLISQHAYGNPLQLKATIGSYHQPDRFVGMVSISPHGLYLFMVAMGCEQCEQSRFFDCTTTIDGVPKSIRDAWSIERIGFWGSGPEPL